MGNPAKCEFHISGHVQGVGYRYFVYTHALRLGLTGFAKNNYDGSVSVTAEGNDDNIKILEQLLNQGPSRSNVTRVTHEYSDYTGNYKSFNIR